MYLLDIMLIKAAIHEEGRVIRVMYCLYATGKADEKIGAAGI